eukprot:SAG22_NODE_19844_length_271_cov_0.598837_1_plen_41_part_01
MDSVDNPAALGGVIAGAVAGALADDFPEDTEPKVDSERTEL